MYLASGNCFVSDAASGGLAKSNTDNVRLFTMLYNAVKGSPLHIVRAFDEKIGKTSERYEAMRRWRKDAHDCGAQW